MRSADTSPEIHSMQIEIYRSMTPARRTEIAVQMSEELAKVSKAGIRTRHPDYSDDDVRWAGLRLRHGDETFRKVWPGAPLLDP